MQIIKSVEEMQTTAMQLRFGGNLISLVPTMGCLHQGHISLIQSAREKADKLIVSIFVNPMQFGPNEDFSIYPKSLESDLEKCQANGVDFVFTPSVESMYPKGFSSFVGESFVSSGLCGISRPTHFRGVATVCLKLFNLVRPDYSFFGRKDAQQCAVIKKMVHDLNIPTEVFIVDTVRDSDGLAMSSRNRYLSKLQREDALSISKALFKAKELVQDGVLNVDRVVAEIIHMLSMKRRIRVIYVQVVNNETMEIARKIESGKSMVCLAVWVDSVRLIDNIIL